MKYQFKVEFAKDYSTNEYGDSTEELVYFEIYDIFSQAENSDGETIPAYTHYYSDGTISYIAYAIDGKFNNYNDPDTGEVIPAEREWWSNGNIARVEYSINNKLNNHFDKETNTIIPAYRFWWNNGLRGRHIYHINGTEISNNDFMTLYHTLPFYVKKFLSRVHSRNKRRSRAEYFAMQEYILRPGGEVAKKLESEFKKTKYSV